jgi:type IV secretion system protein VirD4
VGVPSRPATAPATSASACTSGCTPAKASPTSSACGCAGSVLRRSGQIRPALPWRYSLLDPREHSVFLGRAHYRHGLRVPLERHLLVMAPPRTYKAAFLADVIIEYHGPVIATTTKPDIYNLTSAVRAYLGPVHVFKPQHIGGVPVHLLLGPHRRMRGPVHRDPPRRRIRLRRVPERRKDGTFGSAKASDYLSSYFHAAALADYDLRTVAAYTPAAIS